MERGKRKKFALPLNLQHFAEPPEDDDDDDNDDDKNKTPPKEPKKGGDDAWKKDIEAQIKQLTEALTGGSKGKAQEIPQPTPPKTEEPPKPEEKKEPETPKSSFWKGIMDYLA